MKGLFSKPITYGGWFKMTLIGSLISISDRSWRTHVVRNY